MGTKLLTYILIFSIFNITHGNLHTIYWEPTNNRFLVSVPQLNVDFNDRVTISCPQKYLEQEYTYAKVYMVNEEDYHKCNVKNGRLIAVCDDYTTRLTTSFVIRDMTPIPNGLEFSSNTMYYLISASTGGLAGINRKKGGVCQRKNMRIKMKVGIRNVLRRLPAPVRFRHVEDEEDYSTFDKQHLFSVHEHYASGIRGKSTDLFSWILIMFAVLKFGV